MIAHSDNQDVLLHLILTDLWNSIAHLSFVQHNKQSLGFYFQGRYWTAEMFTNLHNGLSFLWLALGVTQAAVP